MILQKVETEGTLRMQVICVTGTRMISQGIYVLSGGLMNKGVVSVKDMLLFVPLNLSTLQRLDNLLEWINSCWGQGKKLPLML